MNLKIQFYQQKHLVKMHRIVWFTYVKTSTKYGCYNRVNSLTAMAIYGLQVFLASFKVNNFLNFCALTMFDSSRALQLE
jgi:hypothetical protein